MADPQTHEIDPAVAADLAKLALELSHNKDTRRDFGKLVKKAMPTSRHAAAFSDVDLEDKFESFEKRQEEKEIERQKQSVLDRLNAQRRSLLTGGGNGEGRKYSEDDVKKIEDLMQKKGISDYEDGAVLYASTLPPENTKPTNLPPQHGTTWEFPEFARFSPDPVKASREIAGEVIAEFQRNRR